MSREILKKLYLKWVLIRVIALAYGKIHIANSKELKLTQEVVASLFGHP